MEKVNIPAGKISWRKVAYLVSCIVVSVFFAWQFQPKYHDNSNALSVLVTVFSTLAGSRVAVMAMGGSEGAPKGPHWREVTVSTSQVTQDPRKPAAPIDLFL